MGCARMLVVPAAAGKEAGIVDTKEAMGRAWKEVVACAEVELCGLCDTFDGELPDRRFMGRANGARTAEVWSLPHRAAGKEGASTP